ncbi:MAG: Hsp20/alpha crystallin family protein [Lachnospiraceae bacterium]|nr:Hsp20/alpha crystallin family protein [Lachnospiraceae bacterium]
MLLPSIFDDRLFDDWMDFPSPREFDHIDRKLYGKHAAHVMKTDVQEHEDHYKVDIDLPGFKKDELTLHLENGYLTVSVAKGLDIDKTTKKGKVIRQERYAGSMQRSFYVGKEITEEDVKAKFENGVLSLTLPQKGTRKGS